MRTTKVTGLRAVWLSLLMAALACGCGSARTGNASVHAELSDRFPSTTAQDWVTYADFAAVVTVTAEKAGKPDAEDLQRGEGEIERTVDLTVDRVIWQARNAQRVPPSTLEYSALGWQFRGQDAKDRRPVVADDRPRLEVGHTYLMAFAWQPTVCYEGDGVIPGHWNGLGSGSVLPYDKAKVGVGEFASGNRDLASARAAVEQGPEGSLAASAVGQDAQAVADILANAKPGTKGDYGPMPSDC